MLWAFALQLVAILVKVEPGLISAVQSPPESGQMWPFDKNGQCWSDIGPKSDREFDPNRARTNCPVFRGQN